MYLPSSCKDLTPQGKAIHQAAVPFGDGQTLPFSPCKRGFIPIVDGERKYAYHLHHEERMRRVNKESEMFRPGEMVLSKFWYRTYSSSHDTVRPCKEEMQKEESIAKKAKLSKCEVEKTNTVSSTDTTKNENEEHDGKDE